VSGGPYFFSKPKIFVLRYLNPSLPRIPAAISINNSGIPKARRPEIKDFIPVDKSRVSTQGINKGLKKPETKTIPPQIKRPLGGTTDSTLFSSGILF
jgi:hypothetical protein